MIVQFKLEMQVRLVSRFVTGVRYACGHVTVVACVLDDL